jgi:hypothetical protein
MEDNIIEMIFVSILLVLLTTSIFYEILHIVLKVISRYDIRPRPLMFFLVMSIFAAHTIVIWIYGAAYWMMVNHLNFLPIIGIDKSNFFEYIYFSAATYSSLGIGDIFPHGVMQFIAGVEVLSGMMLIGWSVMFTYFAVEKLVKHHNGVK